MESLLHSYTPFSLAPQIYPTCCPSSTFLTLPHLPPPTASFRTIAISRPHSLTWLLVRKHSPSLIQLAALSSVDGGGGQNEGEWHAMDASYAKAFLWQTLKSWGLPVAIGAMVGSLVARQPLVFVVSFSFLIFMVVHKVLETQGEHLNNIAYAFPMHFPLMLLTTIKSNVSKGVLLLPGAITALQFGIRRICIFIHVFVAAIIACLDSIVIQTQGDESHLPKGDIAWFDPETQAKPLNSVLSDIKKCIHKVEGMIDMEQRSSRLDDIHLKELRETLSLLKASVVNLSVRSDGHSIQHLQAALATHDPADKQSVVMPLSSVPAKSQESRRKGVMEKAALINELEKKQGDSNVQVSKQFVSKAYDMDQKTLELAVVRRIARQNSSPQDVGRVNSSIHVDATGKDASGHVPDSGVASVPNGTLLYQVCGTDSANMGGKASPRSDKSWPEPMDAVETLKIGKSESKGSMLSNMRIDQDRNGSTLTSDTSRVALNQSDTAEEKNKEHSMSSSKREELVTADGEAAQREYVFKATGLHANRKDFWLDEPQQHGENQFGSMGLASARESDRAGVLAEGLKEGSINLAEQEGISGRETRVKRPKPTEKGEVAFDAEGHVDGSTLPLESLGAELKSGMKPVGSKDDENVSRNQGPNGYTDIEGVTAALQETRQSSAENETTPNGSVKGHPSSKKNAGGNRRRNAHKEEGNASLLDCTKELAFMREDPDMPALTGFSWRRTDEEFQRLMNEGETLFANGKEGLNGKIEVGEAETMLYKAADLFASAAAMDPSSIEAIGFWGNTLLVHGELKLKLSKELRFMISSPVVISSYQIRRSRAAETKERSQRAAIQQTLQVICEECEELLVEAGRKYRMALSINNSDIRALYNWGLALCFRAQLIAGGGGQNAAEAADRVYMAAIDKFEAMMGISRRYAPGAMLNWGLTLRDRSRLLPMGSPNRIDLLQQAKQLFQDALRLHPDAAQIRGALATCSVELKELQERKELQSKRGSRSIFGN